MIVRIMFFAGFFVGLVRCQDERMTVGKRLKRFEPCAGIIIHVQTLSTVFVIDAPQEKDRICAFSPKTHPLYNPR